MQSETAEGYTPVIASLRLTRESAVVENVKSHIKSTVALHCRHIYVTDQFT